MGGAPLPLPSLIAKKERKGGEKHIVTRQYLFVWKRKLLPPHYSICCPMTEFVLILQLVVFSDMSSLIGCKTFYYFPIIKFAS